MPVIDTATSAGTRRAAPRATAAVLWALTAPCAAIVSLGTASISIFASFEYVMKPRSTTSEESAVAVKAAATSPPVQDSAVARCQPRVRQAVRTDSANASVSGSNTEHSLADQQQ